MDMSFGELRAAVANSGTFRDKLVNVASVLFGGKRDLYRTFGYRRQLLPIDYRSRFERNAVANRLVKALPTSTWRGGAEIVEDENPEVETAFEAAFADMDERLKIWNTFLRVDILAGISRYAVIMINAPGALETPLENASADEITKLTTIAEEDARIESYDADINSPRYGQPEFYTINRLVTQTQAATADNFGKKVHWTRIIHVADGLLDDSVFGEPRLRCVWNLLDDLEKVTGGGSEAFYQRADQGRMFSIDPLVKVDDPAKKNLKKQVMEYENEGKRNLISSGVKVSTLGSDVADFSRQAGAIIDQIATGSGIPQRILTGSERAHQASTQDRSNWDDRVEDRRKDYAIPCIVRVFVDRMISLKALPAPVNGYDVEFPQLRVMDDVQRADIAKSWAGVNQAMGETVVSPDDIRTLVLNLPTQEEAGIDATPIEPAVKAAAKGGVVAYKHIHRSADRFRGARATYRQRLLRRRAESDRREGAQGGARGPE